MTLRPFSIRALALPLLMGAAVLAGCSREAPADAPATDAAATAPAPAPDAAAPAAADPAPAEAATEAPATPAPAPSDVPPPQGPAPVAGREYTEIPGGQTWAPTNGAIEVVEIFGYTCGHCARFDPLIQAWKARQPSDVKVVYVAAPFGGYWVPYAKAFYAAEAMGLVDRTHTAMFRAVHLERSLPVQPTPSDAELAAFYAKHGANPQQFASTMASFAVQAKVNRATQFIQRAGVNGTPSLVVNGKYRIDVGDAVTSHEEMLRIADHLVARERAANAQAATAAAPATAPAAGG